MLAEPGRQYAAYFKGAPGFAFTLELPAGAYRLQWLDVVDGRSATGKLAHAGDLAGLRVPAEYGECALRLEREAPNSADATRL